ncbi:SRPBCC family protein [Jannaschia sp. CCS1]|uniref:SRPBCC family protein n=1 Tax=Jannaschia sp. (strain CCS1) TaxID=290400 RepID=UPI000053A7BC|nr:SRPBCC family protein [Jannaschia sp. CCS1]ABD53019.1 hypothetical protein Jann_0102 [Jannaschia sp. CCS1]
MTHNIQATREIPATANDLWKTVSQMIGMETSCPGLIRESDVLDADGTQPRRSCVMRNGGALTERILLRDDATRTFIYAIDSHPMPAKIVVGTIRIDDLGDGKSQVSWAADMVLGPASADHFAGMVQGMYEGGLASLEAHHTT